MGIFDKVFKSQRDISKKEIVELPWHPLTDEQQLNALSDESKKKAVIIFKHSTRCGISRMVLKSFEKDFEVRAGDEEKYKLYFLDLLANRNISDEVAKRFEVQHESPQVIVLKNQKVEHHASHHGIQVEKLDEFIS